MTCRRSRPGAAVAPTLTGLSLAAGIAREAVDAVPIVKQVFGIVVKILALAEKIDKDRDALHALAEKSAQLARRVKDVLGDEEPDPKLVPSIERLRAAFEDVAAFMEKHLARNRFSRGLCYAFTVNHHIDRLSCSMANALQEVIAVTLLAIKQDAQYEGEFRRIRDCQVNKIKLIREEKLRWDDSLIVVQYHRARVDGKLVVVRYCEGSDPQQWNSNHHTGLMLYDRMVSNDRILKELSTVRKSHPNVARVYGWGAGSVHNRFTVFHSGFRDVHELYGNSIPNSMATLIHCMFKVLDAAHHLRMMGIQWDPHGQDSPYMVDDRLEPTIGLKNDLRVLYAGEDPLHIVGQHIFWSTHPLSVHLPSKAIEAEHAQKAAVDCHNEQLSNVIDRGGTVAKQHHVIPKANFSQGLLLNDDIAETLLKILEIEVLHRSWWADIWAWANILLALAQIHNHRIKNSLHVVYQPWVTVPHDICMHGLVEDPERIVYDTYTLAVPDAQRGEIMEMLGVPPPGECALFQHIAAGTYHAPE